MPKTRPYAQNYQRVVHATRYYVKSEWCFGHHGAGSYELQLACGHHLTIKASRKIPRRAHCPNCPPCPAT